MPESHDTPTYREVLVLGREGGGRDGKPGGLSYYEAGEEVTLEPGDIADVPVRIATSFIRDGFAEATGDFDSEPDDEDVEDHRDPTLVQRMGQILFPHETTEESD
jgi:hypothetical protein